MLSMAAQLRATSPLARWLHLIAAAATGAAVGLVLGLWGAIFDGLTLGGLEVGRLGASVPVLLAMAAVSKRWNTSLNGLPRWWWSQHRFCLGRSYSGC